MADYNLGTARGVIEVEYKGDGVTQAKKDLLGAKGQAESTGQALNKVGRTAGIAGAGIAAGLALAVRSAASFEQKLSGIAAVSGSTGAEMDQVREKALQLGRDTKFSASEGALAIEELVKAGLSVPDVLNGAADAAVSLAAAGEIDLPQAATLAANAMNQFNLSAQDLPKVADLVAGAANASAIDVGEFGQSLQQVGAVAKLAGATFDDTATAIAIMGNAGIKGSDAGTSLKSMLMRLTPQTLEAQREMERLGIVTEDGTNRFYDQNGSLKSLADVSQVLQDSLKGMTNEQKQAALTTLFGSDAIRSSAILSAQGAKGFDTMAASMGKVTAEGVAAKRMDNFSGSLEKLKGSVETAAITIGEKLTPVLRAVSDGVNAVLGVFLKLPSGVSSGIVVFASVAAAILLIIAVVAKIIVMINEFNTALMALRGTMLATWVAALGPIAAVIAAVAAVVAIVVLLWKHSETFRDIVLGVWAAIKAAVVAVVSWFSGTLVPAMQAAWNGIVTAVRVVVAAVATVIRTYVLIWKTIITTAINAILAVWRAIWGLFGPIIRAVFGLIVAIVKLYWTIVKGLFLAGLHAIRSVVSSVFGAIASVVRAYMNAVLRVIRAVWGVIGPYVRSAVNSVKSAVSSAWNAVKAVTSSVWNALKGIVKHAVDGVIAVVRGIKDKVLGPLAGAGSWLYQKGRAIVEGLVRGIESVIHKITDVVKRVTDAIGRFLPGSPVKEGPLVVLNRGHAGKQIVKMITDGVDSESSSLLRTMVATLTVPSAALATASSAALTGPLAAVGASPSGSTGSSSSRLVSGVLRIDERGRAWIEGVAQDVYDVNSTSDAAADRQGRIL